MTDPGARTAELPRRPAKPRIRKPGSLGVIAGSFGLFFAVTALLAVQMRRGADPALGAPKPAVAAAPPAAPRQILVRRVIVTRVVEHRRRRPAGAPRATTPSAAPAAPARPAAPAALAPPTAPAAPAPLTTRSS